MPVSHEIIYNLRILGLPPDATAAEVRTAFRRLAKTCHPDVAGRQGARRFEQITGAYTFLRSLPPEDLLRTATPAPCPPEQKAPGWVNPLAWRRTRRERIEAEEEKTRREDRETEEKTRQIRETRVEQILARGERAIEELLRRMEEEMRSCDTQDLTLRLLSASMEVRHLALSRLGILSNRSELLDALISMLGRWNADEKTARLVAALPLTPKNLLRLANSLTVRASMLSNSLLIWLLRLRGPEPADRELLERYIRNASADGIALILKYWPQGPFISPMLLRSLLSCEDETVLVPLLSLMKQRSILCPPWGQGRLNALVSHPNVTVRVWAKALLSQKTG
ncbi:MAG: J domain-containing protein [Synergistaceae bacterium]|nr:J domain-containing protein [Synergistaceae bacterium]